MCTQGSRFVHLRLFNAEAKPAQILLQGTGNRVISSVNVSIIAYRGSICLGLIINGRTIAACALRRYRNTLTGPVSNSIRIITF